jgi:CelD/BcsL family acetyltransferase involved in cellulose biosynthesis
LIEQQIVASTHSLLALQEDWNSLALSSRSLTPFQMPAWLITWWHHFGSGDLYVLTYRDGQCLLGIVPCFLHVWNGRRQLTLIGSGISDYLDPLIHPDATPAVISRLAEHLCSSADWDVCNWQDLSCETPLRQLAHGCSLSAEISEDQVVSAIDLPENFDAYWSARSSDLRRNVRRYRAKAEAEAPVQFCVDVRPSEDLVETAIQLHTKRWRAVGQPGMVSANASSEFLKEISVTFASFDMTRLFSLRFNGKVVAAILGFLLKYQFFSYISGFDPEFESLGFGRTILFETVRHLHQAGVRRFDFLRGDEDYKSWWGAATSPRCRILITRPQ